MTPEQKELRRKFQDLFKSAISDAFMNRLKEGKVLHMTLTLGGPYSISWDEKPDHMNPLTKSPID